eukprot:2850210-Rhodomonas_salina.6
MFCIPRCWSAVHSCKALAKHVTPRFAIKLSFNPSHFNSLFRVSTGAKTDMPGTMNGSVRTGHGAGA